MTTNPYQSPTLSPLELDPAEEVKSRTPWVVAPAGLMLGALIGGIAGACGSGILGLAAAIVEVVTENKLGPTGLFQTVFMVIFIGGMGAVLGAILGAMCGGGIGFVLALLAAFRSKRFLHWLTLGTTTLSMLCGAGVGTLGGAMFVHSLAGGKLWLAIGASLGIVAGLIGGLLMGRGVATIAWAGRKQQEEKTEPPVVATQVVG